MMQIKCGPGYASDKTDMKRLQHENVMKFPIGEYNKESVKHFSGNSFSHKLADSLLNVTNVTFEPNCRTDWHVHKASKGGGHVLVCLAGKGYYQEDGKDPVVLNPGDCVSIPSGVKHWHGAARFSWFSHIEVEVPGEGCSTEWLEKVDDSSCENLV